VALTEGSEGESGADGEKEDDGEKIVITKSSEDGEELGRCGKGGKGNGMKEVKLGEIESKMDEGAAGTEDDSIDGEKNDKIGEGIGREEAEPEAERKGMNEVRDEVGGRKDMTGELTTGAGG